MSSRLISRSNLMSAMAFMVIGCFMVFVGCNNALQSYKNNLEDYAIIPQPSSLDMLDGRFTVDGSTKVTGAAELVAEGNFLADMLSMASGESIHFDSEGTGNIQLVIDDSLTSEEGYMLSVMYDKITISGNTAAGVFYGIQSLRQLLPAPIASKGTSGALTIPAVMIEDTPRFGYRGMHLDVSRHFFSADFVKRYIDLLAMHKMNTFHWHLTEDQGWRIEIKKYPKLTEVGGWRNGSIVGGFPGTENDNTKHGGFYTQEEIKDIIAYAAKRHITIIPEIELPGHSSAAIAAYPFLSCFPDEPSIVPNGMMSEASKIAQAGGQPKIVQESWGVYDDVYCAGKEETFTFIEDVLSEVIALFPSKFIHIGGDECPKNNWKRCPHCKKRKAVHSLKDEHELQSYFINRVERFVNSKGRDIIGWDEILEGGLAPNATVMSWRGNDGGIAAARANHTVIMAPNSHCYFDHYQSRDIDNEPLAIGGYLPLDKVYGFDPVPGELEVDKASYILGGQANLWTEYIESESKAEYMLLPRMTALSEALWSSTDVKDWTNFQSRLKHFRKRYEAMGVNYATHVFEEKEESDSK